MDFHSTEMGLAFELSLTEASSHSQAAHQAWGKGGLRHMGLAAKREMSKIEKRSGGREGSGKEPGDKQAEGPLPLRQHIWNIK